MQCKFCKEKATVYFSKIMGGKEAKVCLCKSCAEEKGVNDPDKILASSSSLFEEVLTPFELTQPIEEDLLPGALVVDPASTENVCSSCGFSLADFLKVGRLGCCACYFSFDEEIRARLGKLHQDVCHTGHVPNNLASNQQQTRQLLELQKKLDQAVIREDFEIANELKNEILELKETLSNVVA